MILNRTLTNQRAYQATRENNAWEDSRSYPLMGKSACLIGIKTYKHLDAGAAITRISRELEYLEMRRKTKSGVRLRQQDTRLESARIRADYEKYSWYAGIALGIAFGLMLFLGW